MCVMAESTELLIRDVYPGPPGPHSTGSDVIWVTSNLFYTTTDTANKIKLPTLRIKQRKTGRVYPFPCTVSVANLFHVSCTICLSIKC